MAQLGQNVPAGQAGGASGRGLATEQLTPEEKFELLKLLLQRNVEVLTLYKRRRVVAIERADSHVVIRYADGGVDKMHLRDFGRRRFVAVI